LNFANQHDLLLVAKLSKRPLTFHVLCVLGLTLLSGRAFALRQFSERFRAGATVRVPARDAGPVQSGKRILLLATPAEALSNLEQSPENPVEFALSPSETPRRSRTLFEFPTTLFSKPRAYIFQSALNL
jgi:hypothetical protein